MQEEALEFIAEINERQDDALRQIDELNKQIEDLIELCAATVRAESEVQSEEPNVIATGSDSNAEPVVEEQQRAA